MRPTELAAQLQAAYDKVKEWPENSETGFMDLLALRNLVPDAIAALSAALAVEAGAPTATELDVSLALYELITLAKGDGVRSVTDPTYTDRLFTEERAYRLILSALTPASSAVEGEAVASPVGYCTWINGKLSGCAKSHRGSFPVYTHPAPTPDEEWRQGRRKWFKYPLYIEERCTETFALRVHHKVAGVESTWAEFKSLSEAIAYAERWPLPDYAASPAPQTEGK